MNISRYLSSELSFNGKAPKLKSKKHLDWIRRQPCVVSGHVGVDAHHHLKKSQGVNDYCSIPLTHELHMEMHTMGIETFERKHGVDLKDALIAKLVERILDLEK